MATTYEQEKKTPSNPATILAARLVAATHLHIFSIFTLTAIILTYPLIFHLFSYIPRGSEPAGTVPFFNLWTLQWNVEQLMRGYPHYWDAPIFAPYHGTFAFSETQLISGLLAAPFWLSFQSPALAYNALILLFLTLNGWFAYWLLRGWGVFPISALLAALLVEALPFVAQEMGVIQLTALFGFLWSLFFLDRFLSHPLASTWRTRLGLILGSPVTFFTCSYYGLFSLVFLPLACLFYADRRHLHPQFLGQLAVVGLLIAALTGPLIWGQQRQLIDYGFTRSEAVIATNSAKLAYYTNFLDYNLIYGQILELSSGTGQRLFPGFMLAVLAGVGLVGESHLRTKTYLITALLLALLLSLGLRLNLDGWQPYQWMRDYVPGFAQLRSPFRFAAFVQLYLALLAGFGLNNLERWRPRQKAIVLSAVSTLALVEVLALPLPLQAMPDLQSAAPWQQWLNAQNPTARIIFLPFPPDTKAANFEQTTRWMLSNRHLQGDMLNGYSGFFPRDHGRLRQRMLEFPTPEGIASLRRDNVDYIVVDQTLPNAAPPITIEAYLPLVYQDEVNQMYIYALGTVP